MCYEGRRAEAFVDWFGSHHALRSGREGKGYCVKGGWREEGERVKERARTLDFCNQVFHDYVIRKALRRCQPGARRSRRRSSPRFPSLPRFLQYRQCTPGTRPAQVSTSSLKNNFLPDPPPPGPTPRGPSFKLPPGARPGTPGPSCQGPGVPGQV
jgi:hypothetical protein